VSVSGALSINEQGRVRVVAVGVVEPKMSDTAESNLRSWLTDEIERTFEFVPAQYNNAPISSELEVLIRFYPKRNRRYDQYPADRLGEIDCHNHRFGFDSPGEGIRVNIGIPGLVDSSAWRKRRGLGRLDSLEIPSAYRGRISRGFSFSIRIFSARTLKSWPTREGDEGRPPNFQ
jgi:hypothetical protein